MALGAFVDLGVDPGLLRAELEKLGLKGWKLEFYRDERCGLCGTQAVVEIEGRDDHHAQEDAHNHRHEHTHEDPHNANNHQREHTHKHPRGGSWKEIRELIENSGLSEGAKKRALDVFSRIAGAEAQVHGVPADKITFHEVGALDSIIDIAGAAVCLDMLKPGRITSGEIELGGGTVKCAHGVLPVPAPATLILCKGLPVKTGGFMKEMTTPTGAAILASCVDEFITAGNFTEIKTGYGIGARKLDRPNVLRVSWREERPANAPALNPKAVNSPSPWKIEEIVLIEANIDDMTGEALGFLMESLFAAGALDVTFSPCVMKKSRPGTIVSVVCPPGKLDALRETMFRCSSTIGFREIPVRRLSLRREEDRMRGEFPEARRKTVFYGDRILRSKIEYEDRARTARERGISLDEAERLMNKEKPGHE
jgi:uncharacterized protein (TIGR00299 family) protein